MYNSGIHFKKRELQKGVDMLQQFFLQSDWLIGTAEAASFWGHNISAFWWVLQQMHTLCTFLMIHEQWKTLNRDVSQFPLHFCLIMPSHNNYISFMHDLDFVPSGFQHEHLEVGWGGCGRLISKNAFCDEGTVPHLQKMVHVGSEKFCASHSCTAHRPCMLSPISNTFTLIEVRKIYSGENCWQPSWHLLCGSPWRMKGGV